MVVVMTVVVFVDLTVVVFHGFSTPGGIKTGLIDGKTRFDAKKVLDEVTLTH